MSELRGKAREIVVNAGLTACYVLIRQLSDSKEWELDFSAMGQSPEQLEHAVLEFKSVRGPVPVSAGSVEITKLTSDRTLIQFFFSKLPPVYADTLANSSEDFQGTMDKLYDQVEVAMDAVATAVTERLQELKLLYWETP